MPKRIIYSAFMICLLNLVVFLFVLWNSELSFSSVLICLFLLATLFLAARIMFARLPEKKVAPQPQAQRQASAPPKDPSEDKSWLKLVEDSVTLLDEFDRNMQGFDPAQRELAEYIIYRLQEVLERSGVEAISSDSTFDRNRHQPEHAGAQIVPGTAIAEILSPGFSVKGRVLRRARVRLVES